LLPPQNSFKGETGMTTQYLLSSKKRTAIAAGAAMLALTLVGGCASRGQRAEGAGARAEPAAEATPKGPGPGMNANGDVIDSKKVTGGYGRKVKGLGDWDGEITGNAPPDAAFNKLQIGMSMRQVVDLVGPPTDQGGYITGRAFIPFYFGSDRHRFEMAYKGKGRLVFAGGSLYDFSGGNLIWIIHNPNDTGYR
jgi:hypothetical protein